jgi:hypothetical protein
MKLSELFSGREDFESELGIKEFVRNSKSFNSQAEDPHKAEALLIFSTSKQHTWLVCTKERLYCILDDIRKDRPHINWSMEKSSLISGGEVTIKIRTREKSEFTGLVDIGDEHPHWLYTKRLFASQSVESQIRSLIKRNMSLWASG